MSEHSHLFAALDAQIAQHCRARSTDPATSHVEWKKIPGFSRYSVSNDGRVRRDVRVGNFPPGELKRTVNGGGYIAVMITSDAGKYQTKSVHALVMLAFVGPRENGFVICHGDGNPSNNRISNLRYDTPTGNVRDAIRHGTQVKGTRVYGAKLNEESVHKIKCALIETTDTLTEIGDRFGVTKYLIARIRNGVIWKHVEPFGDLRSLRPADAIHRAHALGPEARYHKEYTHSPMRVWEAVPPVQTMRRAA